MGLCERLAAVRGVSVALFFNFVEKSPSVRAGPLKKDLAIRKDQCGRRVEFDHHQRRLSLPHNQVR